jgi:hypothetical protein
VTPASDVYALGALAWWCVTGRPPAPLPVRPDLHEVAGWVPEAWRAATLAALSPTPADRPSAAELALAWFDSAPCEPLHLTVGDDETSLLTQRLRRRNPPDEAPPDAPDRRRGWRRPRRPAWLGSVRRVRSALVAGGAVVAVVAAVATWAVLLLPPEPGPAALPHAAPPGATPARVARTPPTTVHGAAADDPRGLMQALADLRARAVERASTGDLTELDAPGSPALATDRGVLAGLGRSRVRYLGVRLTVRRAVLTSAAADRAVVEAVVDTAAYRVVDAAGASRTAPAVRGQPMRFDLRWVDGRWRVHAVSTAAAGGG